MKFLARPPAGSASWALLVMACRVVCPAIFLLLLASPALHAERLPIKLFTTADGLAHNSVRRIVKDARGFLWFCTAEGLSRFDGYEFTNFGVADGLPHPQVNDFLETRSGEYWVATGGGLAYFNPTGTRASAVVQPGPAHHPMFTAVLPVDQHRRARALSKLYEAVDGTVWVGTDRGLYRVDRAKGDFALESVDIGLSHDFGEQSEIADLLEAHGSMWIATPVGLYRRAPGGAATRYGTRDGLPSEYLSDLFIDHAGRVWVGSRTGGAFRLRLDGPATPLAVDFVLGANDLPHDWVTDLLETSDGTLWVATGRGIAESVPGGLADGRKFRTYDRRNGLSDVYVSALAEDLAGNLWLSSPTSGAMKIARGGVTTFGDAEGILSVNALFEDRAGEVCFKAVVRGDAMIPPVAGMQMRFGCYDGRTFSWFFPEAITHPGWVMEEVSLQARSGEWWIGSQEGLFRFPPVHRFAALASARPRAFYGPADGLVAGQVFRIFEDSLGNIWVSTVSSPTFGLARWEARTGRIDNLAGTTGLPAATDDLPRAFAEDRRGHVWIGFNGGLARYAGDRFEFFTERDGLPSGPIMQIYADGAGRLWVASARGGLVRVDSDAASRPSFVRYTTADGLSSDNVEVITEDRDGSLFLGGGRGIDRFDPSTGHVKQFTVADGLAPGIVKAGYRDRHGVLWFGLTSGLARIPSVTARSAGAPPVWISSIRVAGVLHPISAMGERDVVLDDIPSHDNQVEITFVALGFGAGEVLQYQYTLEDGDAAWSAPKVQRTVTYPSLGPGRYTFRVRAVNSDREPSPHPATVTFTVLLPLWRRGWVVLVSALALTASIYGLYRYRVARVIEIANMRTHLATDLHDDIGANLTRIALLSEVARQTPGEASLVSIARIARESVSSMSDIVWAINPKRESLRDLIRRMRQHAEEIFLMRGIDMRFEAPAADESLKLGMDVRRDLLLIFKEAISNAARHSGCTAVTIALALDGPRLRLSVSDNGTGFDASMDRDGTGLASMKRRARRLGGTCDIASAAGVGTTVTIVAPV